jgi:hypothetical protein
MGNGCMRDKERRDSTVTGSSRSWLSEGMQQRDEARQQSARAKVEAHVGGEQIAA